MPKNLSEVTAMDDLAEKAAQLKSPVDYYTGRRHGIIGLPDNILLFTRTDTLALLDGIRHFHHRNVLILPLKGSGRMAVDGKSFVLEPGRCAMIKAYQFHHYTRLSESGIVWLFITFQENGDLPKGTVFAPKENATFWNDLTELLREYQRTATDNDNRLACRLALLLSALRDLRSTQAERTTPPHTNEILLLRVHRLILQQMQRHIPIAEIAGKVGLSPSHLRARFREAAGKSLGEFQREIHLQKAAELLVQKNMTVTEAAEACGWESAFAFSRAFRRYWGRSPKPFSLFAQSNHSNHSLRRKKSQPPK